MKNLIKLTLAGFMLLSAGLVNAMKKEITPAEREKLNEQLLDSAWERDDFDEVSNLIEAGADVEAKGDVMCTPLMAAAAGGHTHAMRALLDAGANPNVKNKFEYTPLHFAVSSHEPQGVKMLLDATADVEATDEFGNTPLMIALNHLPILNLLIKAKANVNAKNKTGNTALHLAVKQERPLSISKLIKAGADTNAVNNDGHTPLDLAKVIYDKQPNDAKRPSVIKAFITTILPQEIQHIIPAIIALTNPQGDPDKETMLPLEMSFKIATQLTPELVKEKLALTKKYLPDADEDTLRQEIIAGINKAIKKSPVIKANTITSTFDEAFGT